MATYKEIFGKQIKFLSTDPTDTGAEGQVWYNSTSGTFKSVLVSEAWSSGSSMITARGTLGGASTGTQTATVFFGGYDGSSVRNLTEEYNGSGWSAGGVLGTARYYIGGSGTLTAGLGFTGGAGVPGGANATGATEEYNGTGWAAGGTMSTARVYIGTGAGTQTATLCFGGSTVPYPPSSPTNLVEEYNGASWTSSPAMPRSSRLSLGFGTTTAAVNCGGNDFTTTTDEWNGTSWTEGGTMLAATDGGASMGIQTAGIIAGGGNPGTAILNTSSKYDGTTWTALPAIATGRRHMPGAGTTTAAVIGGGNTPSLTTATEEFNRSANVITAGAWASGGALGTARYQLSGFGTQSAGIAYGGYTTTTVNNSEEYNGSAWSATNAMTVSRGQCSGSSIGTLTAGLAVGGTTGGSPNYGPECEDFNGTSWTATGGLTQDGGRSYVAGFGVLTAAVAAGGTTPVPGGVTSTEEFGGSTWTTGGALNVARTGAVGTGTLTAGLAVGNYSTGDEVEEYNGTGWTVATVIPTGKYGIFGGMGTQTDCIIAGGKTPPSTEHTTANSYDGTSWATSPSLATGRHSGASSGTSALAFAAGGNPPSTGTDITEEWTGETSTVNYKTITTS